MKQTVVPNRNKIFSSIIQSIALSIANKTNSTCDIGMGIHSGDHSIYPDCRHEFRDADDHAFRLGNWEAEKVHYYTPYLEGDKYTILKDGEMLCNILGLDFDEIYKRTNTSYKPIYNTKLQKYISDFKSASSVERIEAFLKLGRPDPLEYGDENGIVGWEVISKLVKNLLDDYK